MRPSVWRGLQLSRRPRGARAFGRLLVACYGSASAYGVIATGKEWDVLDLNAADNVLHVVSTLVGLLLAVGPVRSGLLGRPAPKTWL